MIKAGVWMCPLRLVIALFLLGLAQSAAADGGETIDSATIVERLPFEDVGSTCGHTNDYDEICPWGGSTAPDLVYSYTPPYDDVVQIDLCSSDYDTKVYVFAGGPADVIGCNDDGCGDWPQSSLTVAVSAGATYYIVIDGFGGACGIYRLEITGQLPCHVQCAASAEDEGEPPCPHVPDDYDGGCHGSGWRAVDGDASGCADLLGKTCWYYPGNPARLRDEDWYAARAVGGEVSITCQAEFDVTVKMYLVADCQSADYDSTSGGYCELVALGRTFPAHQEVWIVVAPTDGVPAMASNYCLHLCGIEGEPPVPLVPSTWGRIKKIYREAQ